MLGDLCAASVSVQRERASCTRQEVCRSIVRPTLGDVPGVVLQVAAAAKCIGAKPFADPVGNAIQLTLLLLFRLVEQGALHQGRTVDGADPYANQANRKMVGRKLSEQSFRHVPDHLRGVVWPPARSANG